MRISHCSIWLLSNAHSEDLNWGVLSSYEVSAFCISWFWWLPFVLLKESCILHVFISDSWSLILSFNHHILVLPDEYVWVLVWYSRRNFRNAHNNHFIKNSVKSGTQILIWIELKYLLIGWQQKYTGHQFHLTGVKIIETDIQVCLTTRLWLTNIFWRKPYCPF